MTNRELFIQEVEKCFEAYPCPISEGARAYFEQLKATLEKEKAPFTESGAKVLIWMQENYESYNNILKAKEIAEGMFAINGTPVNSRTVSGTIRKLITDQYVVKTAGSPVCYSLTDLGKTVEVIIPEPKRGKSSEEEEF